MVASGYIGVQCFAAVLLLICLVGYPLQLVVEQKMIEAKEAEKGSGSRSGPRRRRRGGKDQVVGDLQYIIHRLGIVSTVMLLWAVIDPWAHYGISDIRLNLYISYNVVVVFGAQLATIFYLTIKVAFVVCKQKAPGAAKNIFIGVIIYLFVFQNVCISLQFETDDPFWIRGLSDLVLIIGEIVIFGVFDYGAYRLRKSIEQIHVSQRKLAEESRTKEDAGNHPPLTPSKSNASKQSKSPPQQNRVTKAMDRVRKFQYITHFVIFIVIILQISDVATTLNNRDDPAFSFPEDDFKFTDVILFIVYYVFNCIMLWYSWLPLTPLFPRQNSMLPLSNTTDTVDDSTETV